MSTAQRSNKKPSKRASRLVTRLLGAIDRTIAAAEETKRLREELDRLALSRNPSQQPQVGEARP